jgi:uncharacterized protein (DUF2267 family)
MNRPAGLTRTRVAVAAVAAEAGAAGWWLSRARHRRWLARRARYLRGRLIGLAYHAAGRHPMQQVSDDVLAERVRSVLGRTSKALDVPRVHATVTRRVVLLHGQVETDEEADTIERTAHAVDGVDGVLSYLHVGLLPGATRPSEGQQVYAPSPALRQLLAAAESAGVAAPIAGAATRAVLATFLERVPTSARDHLLAHLPRDVQVLATPPRRHGAVHRIRRYDDFIDAVLATDHLSPTEADDVVTAVLHALCRLVPEEAAHVAAVLPPELRRLWNEPVGTHSAGNPV